MVSMMPLDVLAQRRQTLIAIVREQFKHAPAHTKGLAVRVLGNAIVTEIDISMNSLVTPDEAIYGGYPNVACLGFLLASGMCGTTEHRLIFIDGLRRLANRSSQGLYFASDDIALLGMADGLASVHAQEMNQQNGELEDW